MQIPSKRNLNLLVVAFILAIMTYSYLNHMVNEEAKNRKDPSYKLFKLTAKTVPVSVRFASGPPEGYRLAENRIQKHPQKITVIGPEAMLEGEIKAETAMLDISRSKNKVKQAIPLESVAGINLTGEPYLIEVIVPIEKLEDDR